MTASKASLAGTIFVNSYLKTDSLAQTAKPYPRIAIMHVVVMLGGLYLAARGGPLGMLAALIVFRPCYDIFAHLREHRIPAPFPLKPQA